jgi:hypothetical protein
MRKEVLALSGVFLIGACAGVHVDEPDAGFDGGVQNTLRDGSAPKPCDDAPDCDDKSICTIDSCQQGLCRHVMVMLDDSDPCTDDTCHPIDGIRHTPVNVDDQDACTMDACTGTGITHVPKTCPSDNNACTKEACTPANGLCVSTPITMCQNGDGCCPSGCTFANDNDCNCNVNLATTAVGSQSAGSTSTSYGPQNLNDGVRQAACTYFSWVQNTTSPGAAYFQYTWPSAVTIGSFYLETGMGECSTTVGRGVGSGRVEWWDGATWQLATTFSGKTDDFQLDLPTAVTTTRLRLYAVTASATSNSLIHEWFVYAGKACIPP